MQAAVSMLEKVMLTTPYTEKATAMAARACTMAVGRPPKAVSARITGGRGQVGRAHAFNRGAVHALRSPSSLVMCRTGPTAGGMPQAASMPGRQHAFRARPRLACSGLGSQPAAMEQMDRLHDSMARIAHALYDSLR